VRIYKKNERVASPRVRRAKEKVGADVSGAAWEVYSTDDISKCISIITFIPRPIYSE
jgi:hypothetical protein